MKKILIIEDNEDIRTNTAEILELSNYEVAVAENGKRGIEKAMEFLPDLIICDIMMPELDGYGVLHAIQKNDSVKHTPFIFLSAKSEKSDFRKGMELGADDYITKPFSGTELLNAVDRRLKKMETLKMDLTPGLEGLNQLAGAAAQIQSISSLTDDRHVNKFKKKQLIYSEGNHPNRLYYIQQGKVKTYKSNEDGKELVTDLFGPGDFLGYVPLLENSVYKETAEALEESELIIIPKEDFDHLIHQNPEVAIRFIQLLAKNVATREAQLLGMAYNSLRKKVAESLLMFEKKFHEKGADRFEIDISRESLASIAGTATESLVRTLSDFRNEKLIEIVDGKISIINKKKLEQLLN